MSISVAVASATVFIDSQRVHIIEGTAWASDSVVVDLHPDMFSDDPNRALGLDIVPPVAERPANDEDAGDEEEESDEGEDAPVEQKTAAPGEKANARRRRG